MQSGARSRSVQRVHRTLPGVAAVVGLAVTVACGASTSTTSATVSTTPSATVSTTPSTTPSTTTSTTPSGSASVGRGGALVGAVVVLDPGHQIGNSQHLAQVKRIVDAGNGIRKACNSTGTETNDGYPESKVTMRIALAAKKRLEARGATVVLTRPREDVALWGPCIDARGRAGNEVDADAVVSIHADGAPATARGFHVIRPDSVKGWTDDVAEPSKRLATAVHDALVDAGHRPATYIGSRDGYDVRSDLGTLNWSDRPIVMIELGNLRSPDDAALLTDPGWQDGVAAAAITAGVEDFLG